MKTTVALVLLLAGMGAGAARADEHLWENFDTLPAGSIASQPGWTRFLSSRTAHVSNVRAHSPSNSLFFPWNTNSPNATTAMYTNLKVGLYGTTGKVVRMDFQMYLGSTNIPFAVALHRGGGELLSFGNQGGVGRIGFDPYHPTPVPLIAHRFVPVTILYHAGRHQYALEYNGERVIDWATAETTNAVTQFHYAIFLRADDVASSVGDMCIDNLRVETYPYDVWAWWRFTWSDSWRLPEQLGQFTPVWNTVLSTPVEGTSDPVWDGWHEFHNEGATRYVLTSAATNTVATPVTATWTLEAVVRISEDQNQTLFHWGRDFGFNSTQAMIELRYEAGGGIRALLRDAQQTTTEHFSQRMISFAPDGRWRHIALVKSGTTLMLYLDYQPVATAPMAPYAEGNYAFGAGTRATIGRSLNNSNQGRPTTVIDEIRFSNRSLEPYDFLQSARAWIVRMEHDPGDGTWNMLFKGILGRTYRIETSPTLGPGASWTVAGDNYVVDTTYSYFWDNITTPNRFVRIIRK